MPYEDYEQNIHYSRRVKEILQIARNYADDNDLDYIGEEFVFFGILKLRSGYAYKVLAEFGVTQKNYQQMLDYIVSQTTDKYTHDVTPDLKAKLSFAENIARDYSQTANGGYTVGTEHILYAILYESHKKNNSGRHVLREELQRWGWGIDPELICERCLELIKQQNVAQAPSAAEDKRPREQAASPILEEEENDNCLPEKLAAFGIDLTERAKKNMLDPVIGRSKEIDKVVQILSRRTKNNPVLIGEPGVGKSAVVEGLAQAIVSGNVPEILLGRIVFSLDLSGLVAGTKYRGEFEERLNEIIRLIRTSDNIILFIDEIHNLVGAGGSSEGAMDASNIMKPLLARGELQTVGATTLDEYHKYIEKDPALERRFTPVIVNEPSIEETICILRGLKDKYEEHHCVYIDDDAIEAAAELSDRYVTDRFLPDKAIDLIDEASSKMRMTAFKAPQRIQQIAAQIEQYEIEENKYRAHGDFEYIAELSRKTQELKKEKEHLEQTWSNEKRKIRSHIGREEIAAIVSEWTEIPLTKLTREESNKLLKLEDTLHRRIIGQDEAVKAVASAIRRSRAGLSDANRPIGSFIFVGPTGVGKTDLTKALAEELFGSEKQIIRLDMSEYMEKEAVAKIIGAPPGYVGFDDQEGGLLTERVRRKPYSVVLFDEIEKAHPDVFNVLLQILDDGRLTDSKGKTVSFKNCVVVMTSNAGASEVRATSAALGFSDETSSDEKTSDYERMKDSIQESLKKTFRPEFLNRFDDIIIFHKLTRAQAARISDKIIETLAKKLRAKGMDLYVANSVKEALLEEGYSELYGARPLARVVRRRLETPLSEEILAGNFTEGYRAIATMFNDKIVFRKEKIL